MEQVLRLGGRCMDCGFNDLEHLECFDFDYRDPSSKREDMRYEGRCLSFTRLSNENLRAEVDKCDLVCANCHRIRSKRQAVEKAHG